MNKTNHKTIFDKNKSLAKKISKRYDGVLSQKYLAVMPNGLNWLFLCPNFIKGMNPSYLANLGKVLMVWLILQNKPIGKYAKRFTRYTESETTPPIIRAFNSKYLGVFAMKTNPQLGTPAKSPLDKSTAKADNTVTTKHITDLPAVIWYFLRLNLTGVKSSYLLSLSRLASYGGLIGVNIKPKGNSPSRLCAVVETCHPIFWVVSLTKHIGNPTMNFIHTLLLSKLSHFTTAESPIVGFVLGLPLACLVVGLLVAMGV